MDPRRIVPFAVALCLGLGGAGGFTQTASAQDPEAATTETYRLVWADEFNADGPPDPANWGFESGFVRNEELQWYQRENAVCKGGMLVIEARRESGPNPRYLDPATTATRRAARRRPLDWRNRPTYDYTSASVNTRGRHAWLYGRFEIRARIDVRPGSWPAFWALGTRGRWPACGEIDIMEYYRNLVLANVGWAGESGIHWNSHKMPLATFPGDFAEQFHTWRMDWTAEEIRLYLDGRLVNRQALAETANAPSARRGAPANPFHSPQYLLLNQAIGGAQGGDPTATEFPIRYQIDYVRVWQTPSQEAATAAAVGAE